MQPPKDRRLARRLAAEHVAQGDPLGWFERLYTMAGDETRLIPWGDMGPNPNFVTWPRRAAFPCAGKRALQVGCGLGDDAEYLANMGFSVTAFDIAPTAIDWCHERFLKSAVSYEVANLLEPPGHWVGRYDFVLEVYTLQAMPRDLRSGALQRLASFVAPGGDLLIIGRLTDDGTATDSLPWPLMPSELVALRGEGLRLVEMEDYIDDEDPPVRRVRAHYTREA
jgi:2-polyprenyl-3-methyl-5-hydroxy-6-metoxy-1,4-benzoquinol methylase